MESLIENDSWHIRGVHRRPEMRIAEECPEYLLPEVMELANNFGYNLRSSQSSSGSFVLYMADPMQHTTAEEMEFWFK